MSIMSVPRSQLVLLFMLLQYNVDSQQEVLIEESLEVESLHAPTGGAVELPCDVQPTQPEDRVGLVIWYKQGHESPIYSLDTREGVTSHWSDPAILGTRATFRTNTTPAVLILTRLRAEDSGQYRCRVDFIKSQTKNTRLNLTVLIPPDRLLIINQDGKEVDGGVLGPYDEDTTINLTCIAVGGRPTARVSWWKSHALLDNSEGKAKVSLNLHRSDYGTEVTCQAVTDPSITPLSRTLSVDMNLRPLWVRIQGGQRPLVAGRSTSLTCQVVGARPAPTVSWWKGANKMNSVTQTTTLDGNITSSVLTFVPSVEDSGRALSCRVVQPTLVHSTREDGWKLEIQYLPAVKLSVGANINAEKVVEGSDVYLDCRVRANPWHSHVSFTHDGVPVKPGVGVLLANQSLVLQHVSRAAAGAYVCSARNVLGDGHSQPLMLDVKFVPTCKSREAGVVRAARGEVVAIRCELDANPKKPMTYRWWFNSSTHSKKELKTSAMHSPYDELGTFQYVINSSEDYGWVQCAGQNSIGSQIEPCLFQILPAEKPSSVKNCEVTNVTYDSLSVNCTPGYDGGVKQIFVLEIYDTESGSLLRNLTNESPTFEVTELYSRAALTLSIRASNAKGSSDAFILTCSLIKYPERRTAAVPVRVELTTLLVTVLVGVGLFAVLAAVSATMCYCKYFNNRENNEKAKRPQDETSDVLLSGMKKTESNDSVDKNPDIIPIKSKISDNCSINSNRPLMSKASLDKLEPTFGSFHTLANSSQYDMKYRMPQTYQHVTPMANVGGNVCWQPCDNVYEDWLRYKNALPLDTSDLLPLEQLRPPEEYLPPPLVYSDTLRKTSASQLQDYERYDLRLCPVRVSAENNTAYYTPQPDYLRNNPMSPKQRLAKEGITSANKQMDTSLGSTELTE
ncbi:PREDICTED: protein turtle homolog A-like [Papilio xuthus]|uniref:Protein turtle homolog A-like n=1 Tax=Papilio xuthus TaxID=66420 RepID=A0AAJ7EIJ6_PAPXU|nr:PREDICTED: protein turtle homolog A-like [Papilio xuthus]